jgi:hypothetical protein
MKKEGVRDPHFQVCRDWKDKEVQQDGKAFGIPCVAIAGGTRS